MAYTSADFAKEVLVVPSSFRYSRPMRRLSNLRVNRAQAIVPNRQYRIIKSAATRSASQHMFATLARMALDFLTARIEFIGRTFRFDCCSVASHSRPEA